jgi:hypothetical protein
MRLQPDRRGERGKYEQHPHGHIEYEVVRGRNDGEGHRRWHCDREDPNSPAGRRLEEHDADEQVPACVQARQRRVLVRERWGLQRPVPARVTRDRVDEAGLGEPWWRNGQKCKEREADQAGDDHRVTKDEVLLAPPHVQHDEADRDHRPMPVDVDPVGDRDEAVVGDEHTLELSLPGDSEGALDPEHGVCVGERAIDALLGQAAHTEVHEQREHDERELPSPGGEHSRVTRKCSHHTLNVAHSPRAGIGKDAKRVARNYGANECPGAETPSTTARARRGSRIDAGAVVSAC